jgi:hypothetical protein
MPRVQTRRWRRSWSDNSHRACQIRWTTAAVSLNEPLPVAEAQMLCAMPASVRPSQCKSAPQPRIRYWPLVRRKFVGTAKGRREESDPDRGACHRRRTTANRAKRFARPLIRPRRFPLMLRASLGTYQAAAVWRYAAGRPSRAWSALRAFSQPFVRRTGRQQAERQHQTGKQAHLIYQSHPCRPRPDLVELRRFFESMRRSFDALVGRVFLRILGSTIAVSIICVSRSSASRRFCS